MRGHRCRNRNLFHHGGQGDEAPGQEEKERKDSECLGYGQRCRYHRGARDHDGGRGDWPLCDDDLDIGVLRPENGGPSTYHHGARGDQGEDEDTHKSPIAGSNLIRASHAGDSR